MSDVKKNKEPDLGFVRQAGASETSGFRPRKAKNVWRTSTLGSKE